MAERKPLVWCYEFERDVPYIGLTEEAEAVLRNHFDLITPSLLKEQPERIHDVEGVALGPGGVAASPLIQLEKLTSLRVVANWGVGLNHLAHLFPALKEKGVKLGYTPHAVTKGTADMAMALLLSSARNILSGLKSSQYSS